MHFTSHFYSINMNIWSLNFFLSYFLCLYKKRKLIWTNIVFYVKNVLKYCCTILSIFIITKNTYELFVRIFETFQSLSF